MTSLKHLYTVFANSSIPVHRYKSELTGANIVLAEVDGPLVSGDILFATEAQDDDGLPHALEHLIFHGSELYPFKGVLNVLANRCLASGVDGRASMDHTWYTMQTVGKDGFLKLLPVYLDHLLYPLLTDVAFTTEIHHISGEGLDGGVVYRERQSRENSADSRAYLTLHRKIYPNCGYGAEFSGSLHNLRTSTTNKKVRDYHSEFYRPENMTIVICGQVKVDEVAAVLAPLEKRILGKPKKPEFSQPWQTPVAPLAQSENLKIVYPSSKEDCGLVLVGWRGPLYATESLKLTACSVLFRYLTDTSVSPLRRDLVEIEDPYTTFVWDKIFEYSETLLSLSFANVPVSKIDSILDRIQLSLGRIASGEERIDMNRMAGILRRMAQEYSVIMETNPNISIAFSSIGDALYGQTKEDFHVRLNAGERVEKLLTKEEDFWVDLLTQYLVKGQHVCVRAFPSIEEQQRLSKEEAERVEKQRADFGPNGLSTKGDELSQAMASNDVPPPPELIASVALSDVTNIAPLPSTIYERIDEQAVADAKTRFGIDLTKFPVNVTLCDIQTSFVHITAYMETSNVSPEKRPYLSVLLNLLTESAVRQSDGSLIPHEKAVASLESDTVYYRSFFGVEGGGCLFCCGKFSQTLQLNMKVEARKYSRGAQWMVDLLRNTEFSPDRVRIFAKRTINNASQPNGRSVGNDLVQSIFYPPNTTNLRTHSMQHEQRFYTALLTKLQTDEGVREVMDDLNMLRAEITAADRLSLYIGADWEKVASLTGGGDLVEPWIRIATTGPWNPITYKEPLAEFNFKRPTPGDSVVVGLENANSGFLHHAVHCPVTIDDDLYIPLVLFMQYLTQQEGPFWRQIRSTGLTFLFNMFVNLHEQLLYFTLYKSTNVAAAFKQFKLITEAHLSPDAAWENELLESAKNSLIYERVEREKSIDVVVSHNFVSNCFYRTKRITDINRRHIQKISEVTVGQMVAAAQKLVCPLFSDAARAAVVCHPDKAHDVAKAMKSLGFPVTVATSADGHLLN